jgi:ornithine carbamoyltransferase
VSRNLISLLDYNEKEIEYLLKLALRTKTVYKEIGPNQALAGKTCVLIFEKPSLRTRVTFEVAMTQLGGATINLAPNSISLGKRESVEDVAKNLSKWVDVIVARTFKHDLVKELGKFSEVPVINALTDMFHPCQALAFIMTLIEHKGWPKGAHLVFVGDGNNVANSLAVIAGKLGMDFTLSCPKGYEQPQSLQAELVSLYQKNGRTYKVDNNPKTAVSSADVIYTDVWVSMGEEHQEEAKKKDFRDYQVNSDLLKNAKKSCLVSHCLPAHRGDEITSEVMDSDICICFDEAENRLHAQKAALLALLRLTNF